MFEDQTFEEIMDRMLNSISADIDTREGGVIYNALAPAVQNWPSLIFGLIRCWNLSSRTQHKGNS